MRILLFLIPALCFGQIGWKDLSSTALHAVAPVTCTGTGTPAAYCQGNVATYDFNAFSHSVIDAWGSAAADTIHNQLIITGGGHTDYSGNEVYSLNLNLSPPTMTRQTDPSGPVNLNGETNPDGNPTSRHTGGGLIYLPNEDVMLMVGYGASQAPDPAQNAWWYNRAAKTWTKKGALPDLANGTGWICGLDTTQTTESVVCIDLQFDYLFRYVPGTDTWTTLGASTAVVPFNGNCVVHPGLVVFICIGLASGQPSGIYSMSLTSPYATTNITSSTSGCSALYSINGPGLDYDSSTGYIVGYTGSGNSVVIYDPWSGVCQTKTFSGGPSATGPAAGQFGRLAYFPKLNQHVIVNSATGDAFVLTLHAASLGHSTTTCKDIDGDGYGVGSGCSGPDADDNDATVHSAAQVIAKYGSVQAFLLSIGYQNAGGLSNVRCVSTAGNDGTGVNSTNADTACATPYRTTTGALTGISSPYIVILRTGSFTQQIGMSNGSSTAQNIMMSYPGEQATIDYSGSSGIAINVLGNAYTTFDGLKIKGNPSGAGYAGGTFIVYMSGSQAVTAIGNVLIRCEISGAGTDSNVDVFNFYDFTIEENVIHDPDPSAGQHNIYLGSNTQPSAGLQNNRNILYNVKTGGFPNLAFNGRITGALWDSNMIYNSDQQGVSLDMGVSSSIFRNNLIFNTGNNSGVGDPPRSFSFLNYSSGQCKSASQPSICAWPQTNNIVENNTMWAGTTDFNGGTSLSGYTFTATDLTTGSGDWGPGSRPTIGGNFYRNNIIIDLAGTSTVPAIYYPSTNAVNVLALDTWQNNLINNSTGSPTIIASEGGTALTLSTFQSGALSGTNNSTNSPGFSNVLASYYNSPSSFDFSLNGGSSALGAGLALNVPALDLAGNIRPSPPSIGSYDNPVPACIINGSLPSGTVSTIYGTQTLTASGCGSNTLTWTVNLGSLPTGLSGCNSVTGTTCSVTGTPSTTSGSPFSFTVKVTDGGSNTGTQPFIVTISPAGSSGIGVGGNIVFGGNMVIH